MQKLGATTVDHDLDRHFCMEQAKLQLERDPHDLPTLVINPDVASLFDFQFEDFRLENYDPHPHIRAKVAV